MNHVFFYKLKTMFLIASRCHKRPELNLEPEKHADTDDANVTQTTEQPVLTRINSAATYRNWTR